MIISCFDIFGHNFPIKFKLIFFNGKIVLGDNIMDLERLFFLREEKDLTQEEMGIIVGTKNFSINKWEKGKETIPLKKLNIYSNYFNVSMDYILKLTDNKEEKTKNIELDKRKVGNNIKNIRKKNNLTQRQLADVLNTTHSAIWAYESGRTLIQTSFAYQICVKYNISMDWLCGRTNNINIK